MARKRKPRKPIPYTTDELSFMRTEFARSIRGGHYDREKFDRLHLLYRQNPEAYGKLNDEIKAQIVADIRSGFGG